eukprot:1930898-Prymnesium_polylepis.1
MEDSDPFDVSLAAEADIDDFRTDINWERVSGSYLPVPQLPNLPNSVPQLPNLPNSVVTPLVTPLV